MFHITEITKTNNFKLITTFLKMKIKIVDNVHIIHALALPLWN